MQRAWEIHDLCFRRLIGGLEQSQIVDMFMWQFKESRSHSAIFEKVTITI
jgi:hypothetical protein